MDATKLETTRYTAQDSVPRCRPTCLSSTACRSRHNERGINPRIHVPNWVTQGGKDAYSAAAANTYAFGPISAAIDAYPTDLLIAGYTTRMADHIASIEEAKKAIRPGIDSATLYSTGPGVTLSIQLRQRKNKHIDNRRAVRYDATYATPPIDVSKTKSTQKPGTAIHAATERPFPQRAVPGFFHNGIYATAEMPSPQRVPIPCFFTNTNRTRNQKGKHMKKT